MAESVSTVLALGKYMQAEERTDLIKVRKTRKWIIRDRSGGVLGTVEWYSRWRQYAFFPMYLSTVFNRDCLRQLADFIEEQMRLHG